MKNCMTFALKIENIDTNYLDFNLWYFQNKNPEDVIREHLKKFNRSCRRLESETSTLEKGERLIAFFGFIPYHYDYEGRPDMYDYHFIRQVDHKWMHRQSINADITPISDNLIEEFTTAGYRPMYFAVKQVEK